MSKDEKTPTFSVTSTDNPKSQLYNTSQHESASNPYHPAQVESRPSYTEPQSSSPKDPFLAHLAKLITVQEETNRLQQQTNQYLQRRAAEEQAERERKNERREEDAVEEYAMKNISYCEEFCKATMAVSTLGASGCFVTLVAQIQNPAYTNEHDPDARHEVRFGRETVRLFISLAWTCFIFALGIAVFASSILQAQKSKLHDRFKRKDKVLKHGSLLLILLMELLQLGAFTCLGLVISAYRPYVGWFVVGLAGTFLIAATTMWNRRRREVLERQQAMEIADEEKAIEAGSRAHKKAKAKNTTATVVNNVLT